MSAGKQDQGELQRHGDERAERAWKENLPERHMQMTPLWNINDEQTVQVMAVGSADDDLPAEAPVQVVAKTQ